MRIPEKAPQLSDLLAEAGPARLPAVIDAGILATDGDRYRHWDTLRHIPPPGGGVTHESARHDLQDLSRRGLLEQRRSGREHVFNPVPGIEERLGAAG